ncbi:MAG: ABC transporter substrate-binding protein [Clostridiales bacterium]|jgi:sulfonate transport system substrate-binding protein|nr:ABC transporter substrate-binding protein [Clostridiales bacterium]
MKKLTSISTVIIAAILLFTSACGQTGSPASGAAPDASVEAASLSSQAPATLETIHIGFPSSGNNYPSGIFGYASELGYLEEYLNPLGYTAQLDGFVGAAPAIHEALVAKELDYVVYAGFASDLAKANGIDVTLISIPGWGTNWELVARTNAGIESIADLKGKKIAYTRGASPQMYLIKVLAEAGLTFDDIEPINTTIPEGLAGVVSGSIDATIFVIGQEVDLVASGTVNVIHKGFEADKRTYYEPSVFIARTDVYNENKEVAVAIQKAFLKAKDVAKADPDEYFKVTSEKSGLPLDVVLATAERDFDVSVPLNLDDIYMDSLKEILDFLHANELTQGEIDFDAWIDGKYASTKALEEYSGEK